MTRYSIYSYREIAAALWFTVERKGNLVGEFVAILIDKG